MTALATFVDAQPWRACNARSYSWPVHLRGSFLAIQINLAVSEVEEVPWCQIYSATAKELVVEMRSYSSVTDQIRLDLAALVVQG